MTEPTAPPSRPPEIDGFSYADLARAMSVTYGNQKPTAEHPSALLEQIRAEVDLADMPPGPECAERLFTDALGYDEATWLEHDEDTRGVAATVGGTFVWSDQGTQNLAGWASNVKRRRRKWSDLGADGIPGKVHRGFGRSALEQFDRIRGMAAGADRLVLIGHSRGGAHATCHAGLFLAAEIPVDVLVTAGKPRVGNRNFAGWLSGHDGLGLGVRMVRNNDIVPRFPTVGYKHENGAGDGTDGFVLLWIEHDGDVSIDPRRWARFKDRLLGRVEMLVDGGGEPTAAEVPDLTGRELRTLEEHGLHLLRRVLEAGLPRLADLLGAGPAAKVIAWAVARSATLDLDASVFDGLHDHSIDLYERDLRLAGV